MTVFIDIKYNITAPRYLDRVNVLHFLVVVIAVAGNDAG